MTEPTQFDVREILRRKIVNDHQFENEVIVVKAFTIGVDSDTSPAVDGRNKYIWVREYGINGAVHQVFNPDAIPMLVNFPCLIKHSPKEPYRWEVYGTDWDEIYYFPSFDEQNFGVGTHAGNHEWPDFYPGTDPYSLYPRAISHLRTYINSSLTVNVWAHRYVYNGSIVQFSGQAAIDLSSHQPASGQACLVLIYLDKASNSIMTVAGTTIGDGAIWPPFPTVPDNAILSAVVRLDGDQTSIAETDILALNMTLTESPVTETASGDVIGTLQDIAFAHAEWDYEQSVLHVDGLPIVITGALNMGDNLLVRPVIKDYGLALQAHGSVSGAVNIDFEDGNVHELTVTGATTLSIVNPPTSGVYGAVTIIIHQDGTGGHTVTLPTAAWAGGSAPTLTTSSGAEDWLSFATLNAGSSYRGFVLGLDMS